MTSADLVASNKICRSRCQSLLASLRYLRDVDCLTDITLICHGHNFTAHRLVLAASSSYFREILRQKQKVTKINIRDIEVEVFRTVLNYFYTGQLDGPAMEGSKLECVLSALKNLKVVGLQKMANENVMKALSIKTYYRMWNLARDLALKEIESEVVKFVAANLASCSQMWYFHLLSLQQLMSVLSSSSLNGQATADILQAVATWSVHLPERRKKYVPSLLSVAGLTGDVDKYQRFITCSSQENSPDKQQTTSRTPHHSRGNYSGPVKQGSFSSVNMGNRLRTCRNPSRNCDSDVPVRGPSKESCAAKHRASMESIPTVSSSRSRMAAQPPRTVDDLSLAMLKRKLQFVEGGHVKPTAINLSSASRATDQQFMAESGAELYNVDDDTKALEAFCGNVSLDRFKCDSNRSQMSDAMSTPQVGSQGAGRLAILCLGEARSGLTIQQCFDLVEGSWLPPRPTIRIPADHVTCFLHSRSLYFVGGEAENNQRLQTAYVYRMDSLCLRQIASLSIARSRAAMAHLNKYFYVIGGTGQYRKVLFSVEKYDSKADNWKSVAPLHVARSQPSVATVEDAIFAVGGFVDDSFQVTNSCECYDVDSDQWTKICSLPSAFDDMTALVVEVGGSLLGIRLLKPDTIYQYDLSSDGWRQVGKCTVSVSRVASLLALQDSLWLLDRNGGKFYRYILASGEWSCPTQLPGSLLWPVQSFAVIPSI